MAGCSNYLVATVHWWANNMKKNKEREKKKEKEKEKPNLFMLTESLYYYTLLSKEFLLFSTMPISIETVMPIRTTKAVCLMIFFAIHIFKDMRT